MTEKKNRSMIQRRLIPTYVFLIIVSFISVFPFYWMISAATNTSPSTGTQTSASTTVSHTNTAGITMPKFEAPELYPLSADHNQLLGTHTGTTASGNQVTVANLKITDFKD